MKVYVQVIDTRTGIYQTGMIDEPVVKGKEIENALVHFGVCYGNVKWYEKTILNYVSTSICGEVEGTTKIICVITMKQGGNISPYFFLIIFKIVI